MIDTWCAIHRSALCHASCRPALNSPVPIPTNSGFISRSINARPSRRHTCSCASSLLPIFQLHSFSLLFSILIPRSLPSIYPALLRIRRPNPFPGNSSHRGVSSDRRGKITIPQPSDDTHDDQRIPCGEWAFKPFLPQDREEKLKSRNEFRRITIRCRYRCCVLQSAASQVQRRWG